MIDPLSLIFIPGGIAAMGALTSPLVILVHHIWRHRAKRRNDRARCGQCRKHLAMDSLYLVSGVYVCADCAAAFRVRLRWILPLLVGGAAVFAVTSGVTFVSSMAHGGPELAWWLDGRWIPLLMPSVGVALATAAAVAVGKRYNQLKERAVRDELMSGIRHSLGATRRSAK